MLIAQSTALFLVAGVCEIGGGYLVWQWWRNGAPWIVGVAGAVILFLYGIVPTYQAAHFGRVYAAYGGWFVVLSMALSHPPSPALAETSAVPGGLGHRSYCPGSVRRRRRSALFDRRRRHDVCAPLRH
jgi:drug/metabolite transporter superfamily protein YnfA